VFTGIIQSRGKITGSQLREGDLRLVIDAKGLADKIDHCRCAIGESIAVNGVCLTVVAFAGGCFEADVSRETVNLTTLGNLPVGADVNLEPALRAGDPLGGHLVSGHVDGLAEVVSLESDARSLRVDISVPANLARYIAAKGSVALDGVSLTVNAVTDRVFGVNLVPHTVAVTTFRDLHVGRKLNLEVDTLARYIERLLVQSRA
jgi:riboflavin synthase